jgi:O-antigen chain-terminating methyltransferase
MKRTLERLAHERQEKEKDLARKLEEIEKLEAFPKKKRKLLSRDGSPSGIPPSQLAETIELLTALIDAKDKEWDALGSHHVGLIFKSLEWRVDRLAAETEDAKILMKRFILLREKLERLLGALEGTKLPAAAEVREFLEPLQDWRYAGFENRFRGYDEEVKAQLRTYVSYFPREGTVLDLGCGRGEFLELLRENGIAAAGVDLNTQMVDICLDKGLACEKGDLLERLAAREDGSLAGIFSSQVIEHLTPAHLQKLVELSRQKLAPGGAIVLETINPVSVFALVQIYNLDLSHQKPVHPQALKFMLEAGGFGDVTILYSSPLRQERLQNLPGEDESSAILNRNIDSLNELLFAPANYAAVAKKI